MLLGQHPVGDEGAESPQLNPVGRAPLILGVALAAAVTLAVALAGAVARAALVAHSATEGLGGMTGEVGNHGNQLPAGRAHLAAEDLLDHRDGLGPAPHHA